MNRTLISLLTLGALAGAADFSYVERAQMTGGALVRMTAVLGRLAKGVNDPITTTHAYSGNKKASVSAKSHQIWDLDSQTITSIQADQQQYSVITFAEMAQLSAAMAEKMSRQPAAKPAAGANAKWKASFDKNGQTRQVAGVTASGGTMKLEMEATDAKTAQTGVMKMEIDMFMGKVPGWEVKQAFDRRTGEKLGAQAGPPMQAFAQAGPGAMEAMKEAGRKVAELGEMQLASVTKMYSDYMPGMPPGSPGPQQPAGSSVEQTSKDETTREAESESIRRLGGRLGGLGGRLGQLGKRPKDEQPQQPQQPRQPEQAAAAGPGLLMELTSEVVSYSSTVDRSVFEVPAGFKQVEHPMKKAFAKYADK